MGALLDGVQAKPVLCRPLLLLGGGNYSGRPASTGHNPLRWDRVVLNLPGSRDFDPSLPRVAKCNDIWNSIAGDVLAFVNDLRASGPDEETAWQIARLVAAGLQRLGIQDALRKRRPPLRKTGAWAGALFSTTDRKISQSVTAEKWEKGQNSVKSLLDAIDENEGIVDYKSLKRVRGFLCQHDV
jgi:hypothetical protein